MREYILRQYQLGFISDQDLFNHVKETVNKYRFVIDLKEFNKNLVGSIKFSFDIPLSLIVVIK